MGYWKRQVQQEHSFHGWSHCEPPSVPQMHHRELAFWVQIVDHTSYLLRYSNRNLNRNFTMYRGRHCRSVIVQYEFYGNNTPFCGLSEKFRTNFFSDIFIQINAVFDGLSESELQFLEPQNFGRLYVKILEKMSYYIDQHLLVQTVQLIKTE